MHPVAIRQFDERQAPPGQQVVVAQECECRLRGAHQVGHGGRAVVVERRACGHQPGGHAHHNAPDHLGQRRAIGAAHIAVADGAHERGHCLHQPGNIVAERGPVAHQAEQRGHHRIEIGQERLFQQHCQLAR